jgi:uridine phosphorylase
MIRSAWYIGCSEDEVGEAAILVGDRSRIDRIAEHLEQPHFVEENRGLRTVTGLRAGRRITVSAFGMGGPIAAIVLHELFDLGVRTLVGVGSDRYGDGNAAR